VQVVDRFGRSARAIVVVVAVVTVAAYLALLGWHHLQDYETWKVWTLIGLGRCVTPPV
jgi:hypothetical protein